MSLRLHDTATRTTRPFEPLVEGAAGIYLCGATVQSPPHIGHLRSGVAFDVLRRWLEHRGCDVTFVRNVTDVDDKILHRAGHEGRPWWEIAARNERAFTAGYDAVGCLPPTVEPRATGHMTDMVELMHRLVDKDVAYAVDGDVYFGVRAFPDYGALSGQRLDAMQTAADTDETVAARKRDPRDFALWKGARPGEPSWPTPWGDGRPGWHLECSAMARRYLGPEFDIHGGGIDLVFPHHENERAQSCAAGDGFARYWMHNAWVTIAGEKMSKSLGNSLLVSEMVRRVPPAALRYYLVAPHYRSAVEYSEPALQEAVAAWQRLCGFVERATDRVGEVAASADVPLAFAAALDDDLGVPQALAVVHATVREGNAALAAAPGAQPSGGVGTDTVARCLADARAMLGVLGLDPLAEHWRRGAVGGDLRPVVDALVAVALEQRAAARDRRDYAAADAVRDALARAGVQVEDTPHGPRWTLGAGA